MTFRFFDVRTERPVLRTRYDLLLGIIATFEIQVGDRLLYSEVMFPIVELCVALKRWMAEAMTIREPFEFQSMESEEPGLVWIRPQDGGWRIGAVDQEYLEMATWSDDQIVAVAGKYIDDVRGWLLDALGVDLERVLG
ncbi:MAG: DUF7878 domain-containing protein [Acidimicrobiales bacterium]